MTLGRWMVPVYEIYKVGAEVEWSAGLDLLGRFGLEVAVIAHFDNAEGGTHDTRYCYLGEPRLRRLEAQLPEDGWVLGVDEHTACIIDWESSSLSVWGLGAVTVRVAGLSQRLPAGQEAALASVLALAASLREEAGRGAAGGQGNAADGQRYAAAGQHPPTRPPGALVAVPGATAPAPAVGTSGAGEEGPFLSEVRRLGAEFDRALQSRDARAAMDAIFALEDCVSAWSADTAQSDQADRARESLRRMLARLGELAAVGLRDPRSVVAPWVGALLEERAEARSSKRFADGDRIRDALAALGVEVRDTPDGSQWELGPGG